MDKVLRKLLWALRGIADAMLDPQKNEREEASSSSGHGLLDQVVALQESNEYEVFKRAYQWHFREEDEGELELQTTAAYNTWYDFGRRDAENTLPDWVVVYCRAVLRGEVDVVSEDEQARIGREDARAALGKLKNRFRNTYNALGVYSILNVVLIIFILVLVCFEYGFYSKPEIDAEFRPKAVEQQQWNP